MPKFGHVVNLFSMCYDQGSKVVGMIEERTGRGRVPRLHAHCLRRYQYRILRVADFRRELEAYTGHSWDEFFHDGSTAPA